MQAGTTTTASNRKDALDARRAVEAALVYFKTLTGSVPGSGASLEEVELSPDRKHWLVTLSYEEQRPKRLLDLPEYLRVPRQKFKVFKVERSSGHVISMKMRNGA